MRLPEDTLTARADALQDEALELTADPSVRCLLTRIGEPILVGSVVSNLMVRREVDVVFKVECEFGRADALAVTSSLWSTPEVRGVTLDDEVHHPGDLDARDDRFHIEVDLMRPSGLWCLDLSLFLHDDHRNVARQHERLRDSMTVAQRRDILRIKDERAHRPGPGGSLEVYDEVLGAGWRAEMTEVDASRACRPGRARD